MKRVKNCQKIIACTDVKDLTVLCTKLEYTRVRFRSLLKGLGLHDWQLFDSVLGDDLEAEKWEVD